MDNTLVFIDAGFLSKLSKYFGNGKYLKYDMIKFSQNLAKKQNLNCNHIFYYTTPPFQSERPNKEESGRYEKYENFKNKLIKNLNISLREGRCQRLKIDGKFFYNQKGVDALIIIDLMSIPLEHSDVKKIGIDVILYTFYSKNRKSSFSRSNELLKTVSRYVRLKKEDFENSKLENLGDKK